MEYLQKAAAKAKSAAKAARYAYEGLNDVEIAVMDATDNEKWGPHGADLKKIANLTRDRENLHYVMKTLRRRLEHRYEEWRHVYKALTVMEYLVAHGAEDCVRELRRDARDLERLSGFKYKEPNGRDQGINVRQKSQTIVTVRAAAAVDGARARPSSVRDRARPPPPRDPGAPRTESHLSRRTLSTD